MKPDNFFSKAAKGILFVLCLAVSASQAYAELKIDSVSQTVGVMGKNMEVTLTGSGFDENTKVSMYIDSGNRKAIIGALDTPWSANDVKVNDGKAYVADGKSGLQIIDVGDPKKPQIIGAVATPEYANAIAISGNYAFVAWGEYGGKKGGLQIIDISDPKKPQNIGSVDTIFCAAKVAINGYKAYVVVDNGEFKYGTFQIVDISDPKDPITIQAIDTLGEIYGIVANGDIAYVATGFVDDGNFGAIGSLQIIDISVPMSPKVIGFIDTSDLANAITVAGDKAYVATQSEGIKIIDISDLSNPEIIGSIDTPGLTNSITVNGNTAYVTSSYNGSIQIINISDPKNPQIIGSVIMPDNFARGVTVNGDKAYVANGYSGGLQVIDVNHLSIFKSVDTDISGVTINGDKAYVTSDSNKTTGFQVFDISDHSNLKIIGSFQTACLPYGVAVNGEKAYIFGQLCLYGNQPIKYGLQIIDISDPKNLKNIEFYDMPDRVDSVNINGDKAYVILDKNFWIIDISDPKNLTHIGFIDILDYEYSVTVNGVVTVNGDKAYVASRNYGLQIIDVSDPKNPKIIGAVNTPGDGNSVTVIGDKAYIADGSNGLQVIDISDPQNPKIIRQIDTLGNAKNVAIIGDMAYVASLNFGVQIINISDIDNPHIIGYFDIPGYAQRVSVTGDMAYVGGSLGGGLSSFPVPAIITPLVVKNEKEMSFILPFPEIEGDYIMRVYNQDGKYYERRNAVTVIKPENDGVLNAKAIIVAGDKNDNKVREEIKTYSDLAYKALRYQGYTEDNVRYLSNLDSEFSDQVDRNTSKQNLRNLITSWAVNDPKTSDLMIYFVGHGTDGEFIMADNEKVAAAELNNWLNELKSSLPPIRITFIYDACRSGSFVSKLKGKDRVIITSSDSNQPTYFTGNNAFSYHLWSTLAGETVRQVNLYDAFKFASEQSKIFQTAIVDTSRDGIADNDLLKTIKVGRASFNVDMTSPSLISQKSNQILNGESSATLQIEVAKADDNLRMWASIIPPDYIPDPDNPVSYCSDTNHDNCISRIELSKDSDNNRKYTVNYDQFNDYGTYTIVFQAEIISDSKTSIFSLPQYRAVTQMKDDARRRGTRKQPSSDALLYEENDTFKQANYIAVNNTEPQHHTFYKPKDEDWLKFNAASDKPYNIKVRSMNVFCDVLVELYGADGKILPESQQPKDMKNPSGDKILTWTRPDDKSGVYYVRLRNADENIFGETIKYDLEIYQPTGDFHGYLEGKAPAGAVIKTDEGASDIADSDGNFTIVQKSGNSTVTVWVSGYKAESNIPISILEGDTTTQDLSSRKLTECQSPTVKIISPSSTTIIDRGESVNFQGNVTGGKSPFEYFWYFGGAPNSDKENPGDVVFDKPDNPDDVNIFYPVLYVKDADGCVGKSQPVAVKVNYVAPQPEEDSGGGGCFIRSVF